jgi:hypothetical protein
MNGNENYVVFESDSESEGEEGYSKDRWNKRRRTLEHSLRRGETHRSQNRAENMSEERVLRHRRQNRAENMSAEALLRRTNRRHGAYVNVSQEWDFEHPCPHCGHVYLKSSIIRKMCCLHGRATTEKWFPRPDKLPLKLRDILLTKVNHFSRY